MPGEIAAIGSAPEWNLEDINNEYRKTTVDRSANMNVPALVMKVPQDLTHEVILGRDVLELHERSKMFLVDGLVGLFGEWNRTGAAGTPFIDTVLDLSTA